MNSDNFEQKNIENITLVLTQLETYGNQLFLEGYITLISNPDEWRVVFLVDEQLISCKLIPITNVKSLYILAAYGRRFNITLPIQYGSKIQVAVIYEPAGKKIVFKNIAKGNSFPINHNIPDSYFIKNNYMFTCNESTIFVKKPEWKLKAELRFLKSIYKVKGEHYKKSILARISANIIKAFYKRDIWIVSDRVDKADDNGEAFFRYLVEQKEKNKKLLFAIRKDSHDYQRIKKIGTVINIHGNLYRVLLLVGITLISSHANGLIPALSGGKDFFRDMTYHSKFVFLRHGITKDDMSNWLNKYNINANIFITATKPEYHSILDGDYFYGEDVVKLTGFPRYDNLYDNNQKYITFMPTWRKNLVVRGKLNRPFLIQHFAETDYFMFHNNLLNNEKLIAIAKEHGYKLAFMIHPVLLKALDLFDKHPDVHFYGYETSYREIYAKSALIVTDFSSAVFDAAYLRKPIIYTQFDKESFYSDKGHYAPGYFSYEDDGFGEVEYDLESSINRIIEYIENGCMLKDKYRERIEKTFAFNDKNNCERVYKAILELE